jgi:integrase
MGDLYHIGMKNLPPTWATEITSWSTALRAAGREEGTIVTRTTHLRWIAIACAERSPWELTLDDLLEWMGSHTAWERETRRSVRSSLRSFYTWGVTSGRVATNPATDLPTIRPGQPAPKPTPDMIYRRAIQTATPRERIMLRLAAECGLRRAEVAQVHSRDLVQDLGGYSLLVHGKGSKERLVPLRPTLGALILELGPGYIFPSPHGGHLSPRWVGKLVARLLGDEWTMHSLRHRFASLAYAVDRDTFTVQDLLGHASPATTRRYVRMPDDAKRRIVMALADQEEGIA